MELCSEREEVFLQKMWLCICTYVNLSFEALEDSSALYMAYRGRELAKIWKWRQRNSSMVYFIPPTECYYYSPLQTASFIAIAIDIAQPASANPGLVR
jgi:hypothetical protein